MTEFPNIPNYPPHLIVSDRGNESPTRACKVCGFTSYLLDVVDFKKCCNEKNPYYFGLAGIPVYYFACAYCGYIFTDFFDAWTTEQFQEFVYNEDYAKVDPEYVKDRPLRDAEALAKSLESFQHMRILDYGSGTGVLSEKLRELGFALSEGYDPFSSPSRPKGPFDVITCIEVIEHTVDPVAAMNDMVSLLGDDGLIILGTGLQPNDISSVRANWWYIAPRNGHVSIFSQKALARLAARCGMSYSAWNHLHLFRRARDEMAAASPIVGESVIFCSLFAPQQGVREGWHNCEEAAGNEFRWTAVEDLVWDLPFIDSFPCLLKLEIPYIMEVVAEFATRSIIRVGLHDFPVVIEKSQQIHYITSDVRVSEMPQERKINLRTPPPIRVSDIRDTPDRRRLGLAVLTRL